MGYFGGQRKMEKFTADVFNSDKPEGKKTKEVYTTLESLCHAWASENVPRGRSGGSMFFENGIVYSYGHHYAAAKIHTNKQGQKLVLINSVDYSHSTSNHLAEIRSAVNHLKNLRVPKVSPENKEHHLGNLEYLFNLVADHAENLFLLRGYSSPSSVENVMNQIETYCNFFGLKSELPKNWNTSFNSGFLDLLIECFEKRAQKNKNRDALRKERTEKAELELKEQCKGQLEKLKAEFPAKIEQWKNNLITNNQLKQAMGIRIEVKAPFGRTKGTWISIEDSEFSFLRVVGNKVETSNGADVPLNHAVRLLRMILNKEARKGERVGHYTFESVSDLKREPVIVKIGCHKILLSEAIDTLKEHMGPELKLIKEL